MPNFTLDTSFSPQQERQVLVDLYNATRGHQWCNNTGWLDPSVHHCSWYGITCYENASYVKSIQLAFNNLNGFLPGNLWRLRNLLALCPGNNPGLGGQMKEFLFPNMTKLLAVYIKGTSYSGHIPSDIVKLVYLQNLFVCNMEGEKLSGPLPEDLGNMTELRFLGIAGNKFEGNIPRSIRKLSKLYYLVLHNAQGLLSGRLDDLFSLKSLKLIYVSGVTMEGTLPDPLPCRMRELVLIGNKMKGRLPSTYRCQGQPTSPLSILQLNNNMLSGDIPQAIFNLQGLMTLDLSNNHFTSFNNGTKLKPGGPIVKSLHLISFAEIRNLSLDLESFSTFLWQKCPYLTTLNFNNCDIKGKLTRTWWYLLQLTSLDLGNNQIYGTFPGPDGLDYNLITNLDLSNNNLSGPIPYSIYSATYMEHLNITGNPAMSDGGGTRSGMNPRFLIPDFRNMVKMKRDENFTCPQGRFTSTNARVYMDPTYYSYRYCVCDDGHYGSSGVCHTCMPGGVCHKAKVEDWRDLNKSVMIMNTGLWPSPKPGNVSHLVQCPSPKPCNPSGSCSCWLEAENRTDDQVKRPNQFPTQCNSTCLCSHGNTDRFCSRCFDGYYKSGELCYECNKDRASMYVFLPVMAVSILFLLWAVFGLDSHPRLSIAVVFIEFLLMVLLVVLGYVPSWVFKMDAIVLFFCVTSRGKTSHSLLKIAMFYLQTLDSLISSVNAWPEPVLTAQHYFSSLWNLHFPALSCDFPKLFTPTGKLSFMLLLPPVCITLTWLYYAAKLIYHKFKRNEGWLQELNFKSRQLTIMILNFTYFPLVESTISVLTPCQKDGDVSYLRSVPWVECSSETYHVLHSLGWCSLAVYVLGVPFLIFLPLLFTNRTQIHRTEEQDLDSWLGSLYSSYKAPYRWYFEMIVLVRRLFLAFALSFIDSSSPLQTLLVCIILTVAAALQLQLKPYKSANNRFPVENTAEALTLAVLANSFAALRFATRDSSEFAFIIWCVIGVNSLVVVGFVVCVVILTICGRNTETNRGYQRIPSIPSELSVQ